jgi:hypothetical protein
MGLCWLHAQALAQVAPRSQLDGSSKHHISTPNGILDLNLQIIDGEYFVDTDPGEGLGIHITATYNQPEVPAQIPNPIGFTEGHALYVRFKNSDSVWCRPRAVVYRVPYPMRDNNIIAGQYFVNNGTPQPISIISPEPEPHVIITPPSLSDGDVIYVQFKSSNGQWGNPRALVYHAPYPTMRDLNVDSCEYFVNSGNGINVPITPSPEVSTTINSGTLSRGDVVYVRFHSTNGNWCQPRAVVFRPAYPMSSNTVLAGEYFIDNDLGEGHCTAISATYNQPEVPAQMINPSGFIEGHTLYIRFFSSDGIWCRPRAIPYKPALPFARNKIVAGEWFLNIVPPGGGGNPITPIFAADSVTASFTFPAPPESTVIYARFKNSNLVWGPPRSKKFQHPAVPVLASPSNGTVFDTNRVIMRWHPADAADSYWLQISRSPAFDSLVVNAHAITDTADTVTGLQYGRIYYWRVASKNALDSNHYCSPWGYSIFRTSTHLYCFELSQGWNMISNPATNPVPDDSAKHLYPTIISSAYRFSNGYIAGDTVGNGIGYWGKFPSAITQCIAGTPRIRDSISVVAGWNMIGSISNPVDTSTIVSIPPGLRASNWYGWSGAGYVVVTQLAPGKAFWVKTNSVGKFVLASSLDGPTKLMAGGALPIDALNTLTIADGKGGSQTLYFGPDAKNEIQLSMFALPPKPPAGAFDARFETSDGGFMVQTHIAKVNHAVEFPVAIQSDAYPLAISWQVNEETSSYQLEDGLGEKLFKSTEMKGSGSAQIIESNISKIILKVTSNKPIPTTFALSQNYPNPFNPTTTIKYDLPQASHVTIKLYDILGREVSTLVNEKQEASFRQATWNATNFASGVYFYRLQAGDFVGVKKLMLLK